MPDTPAETLRAAARVLGVTAESAAHVPTPLAISRGQLGVVIGPAGETVAVAAYGGLAELIAMTGPQFGVAAARWLEATAVEMTAADGTEYAHAEYASWTAALAVARALLGGTS